ncbi:MAG: 1-(5-phosphoribosyl)-5-[(5-phosphoribosylamino)methylideneamino]imidazole-4-carboxamide isomerase [Clostridia bacterium]|nr:1-(5-phosphoribosyl)-5-[(5-phosphoribosylamino)methylideneamino]imidazole-4-carboxamide isomerase [Clostridia bacterium]
MLIYPAIDLYGGKAVRLYKGDYAQMTVYNDDPRLVAADFASQGATCLHLVDLEGAKTGETPNLELISELAGSYGLFTEVGGGIRSMSVIERYVSAGVRRVILGTAAVTDPGFAAEAVREFGEKIALGVDLRDGFVAIKGWTETTALPAADFCARMRDLGIGTMICTDISRDGAMKGTNVDLYRTLSADLDMNIIASGGVSSLDDIRRLRALDLYGAIVGKAYYTGAVSISDAIEVAR